MDKNIVDKENIKKAVKGIIKGVVEHWIEILMFVLIAVVMVGNGSLKRRVEDGEEEYRVLLEEYERVVEEKEEEREMWGEDNENSSF